MQLEVRISDRVVIFLLAALLALCACGGPKPPRLTDEVRLLPVHARVADPRNPSKPGDRRALLAEGFGEETERPGEAHVAWGDPHPGTRSTLVARFVHLADAQLTDDESPGRVSAADQPGASNAAYRPHDAWLCRMVDGMVRQTVALQPDFLLLGGDNLDNQQSNEVDWFLKLLEGGSVECDSGDDDAETPKTAFSAAGLGKIPWLWVTGNHDVLVQGNFVADAAARETAVGSRADLGTRDWRLSGGPVVQGDVPADARRKVLSPSELHQRVLGRADERANYTWDLEGTPLRVVVLDTAARSGGSDGVVLRAAFDEFLKPALDAAKAEGKWVVLTSHHATTSIGDGNQVFGTRQPDAVPVRELVALMTSYPNVLLSLVGHGHEHRVRRLEGQHPLVEVMTAAIADWPFQSRLIEVFDEENGWLRIRATGIDVPADTDELKVARALGVLDWTTKWFDGGAGGEGDGNVEIWVERP